MADSTRARTASTSSSDTAAEQPPTAPSSGSDPATTPPATPSSEPALLPKEQKLHHRDGRVRVVSTPSELVAAEFDGFAKKAPDDLVFGQAPTGGEQPADS